MGKADQISSIFWFGLSLLVMYGSYRLGLGILTNPGPGFLPFWCGVILCGLSALVFFQGRLTKRREGGRLLSQLWIGMDWPKPIYVIAALLAYGLTLNYLGFLVSSTLMLIFFFKVIEPETWLRAIVGAVLAVVSSYALFGVWLQVQLPRGFMEKLLF
jgi:putative tricarboxylic transport membrane protein